MYPVLSAYKYCLDLRGLSSRVRDTYEFFNSSENENMRSRIIHIFIVGYNSKYLLHAKIGAMTSRV